MTSKKYTPLQLLEVKASTKKSSAFIKLAISDECFEAIMEAYFKKGSGFKCDIEVMMKDEELKDNK
jgi:hypothetical protein